MPHTDHPATPQPALPPQQQQQLAPHAPLTDYYAAAPDREAFVRQIFDSTAPDYDRIEAILALGTGRAYRRRALVRGGLQAGAEVLDVGIGTGLLAREALAVIGPQGRLVGVDPSPGMLGQVDLPGVQLLRGMAEQLPRDAASCDFLSMGYALRHIQDLTAAFAEFHRVLRPGGRLLLLEITQPQGRLAKAALKTYMRVMVPAIARVAGGQRDTAALWRYFWDTIEACVPPAAVLEALRAAGFSSVERYVDVGIFSEYRAVKTP